MDSRATAPPAGAAERVALRPLTGADELSLRDAEPSSAYTLLARLASRVDGQPLDVQGLAVHVLDRILAEVYRQLYGDEADSRARCRECGVEYEFTLTLSALAAAQADAAPPPPDADGAWTLPDGRRARPPLLADLQAAADRDALLALLVIEGDPQRDPDAVGAFLERAAPVLSVPVGTTCPHCGAPGSVEFDLARFLAQRLLDERPFLLRETHLIASRYGWSHREVMALDRDERRAYAGLIQAERSAAPRHRSPG